MTSSLESRTRPVERRRASELSYPEFHREYVMANRPLIIEDSVSAWPALRKWTPEFFKKEYGSKHVQVSIEKRMAFGDYIDRVMASSDDRPAPYMYRLYLGRELPDLLEDLQPPNPYSSPGRLASPLMPRTWRRPDGYFKLLIGGVGSEFPVMHFDADNHHACVTQIHGDKRFVLFPPGDSPHVYPDPKHENRSQVPSRHVFNGNYEQYPLLGKAIRHEAVVRPGEMIFIPCRWWHLTRVESTSIAVCQNKLDRSNWKGFVRCSTLPSANRSVVSRVSTRVQLTAVDLIMSHLVGV